MNDPAPQSLSISEQVSHSPAQECEDTKGCFADHVRNFSEFGQPSIATLEGTIPYVINEFWTARQRQAHSIHEVSYRACFKPQLPAFFIKRLTRPGDGVYDPFMGRGTTPVQAALMGAHCATVPFNVITQILKHPLTDKGLEQFLADAKKMKA